MKKIVLSVFILSMTIMISISLLRSNDTQKSKLDILRARFSVKDATSSDHSKFPVLKQTFKTPQEVTAACLSCHTGTASEIMKSNHWNWERPEYIKGRGVVYLGKKNAINNFCIGVEGNEQSCAKCHIGFGLSNTKTFGFNDSTNIDCLVCHDNSETYLKGNEKAGYPKENLDLSNIAQHVGKPKRTNCGVCHFFGGGGNNVKHGDLEKSMFEPSRDIDVHMASTGMNIQCTDCHTTKHHTISGKMYSLSSMNRNRALCEDCHSERPHADEILNKHTYKVACQTCHISTYAKANATKTSWDWQAAGKLKDGKPIEEDDKDGNHTYLSIKGRFTWGKNLKPDYIWFNGTASHYLLGDVISDTTKPLIINPLYGSYDDKDSKIIPVKIHTATQPFDPVTGLLIQPKLFADKEGEGAFWKDFDWKRAAEVGMHDVNLPASGKVSFLKTVMYWPVNHMVSTKENTVKCVECHTSENGRLAGLKDFYMPARDHNSIIETLGKIVLMLTFLSVLLHGIMRIYSTKKLKRKN